MPGFSDHNYFLHHYGGHDVVFEISDQDTTGTTKYYGFLANNGAWVIQRWNTTTDAFRYVCGSSDYVTNWGIRASITAYDYYDKLFTP